MDKALATAENNLFCVLQKVEYTDSRDVDIDELKEVFRAYVDAGGCKSGPHRRHMNELCNLAYKQFAKPGEPYIQVRI